MRIDKACLVAAIAGLGIAFAAPQDPLFQVRVDVPLVSVDARVSDSRAQPMTSLA